MYEFDIPANNKSIIKVIGVGGGGGNAINYMYECGIKDVEFIVCNTDAQVLSLSQIPHKMQIGANLTEGLGAGTNPEKGKQAAIEDKELIREALLNTKMVFITAGMGGGTGTGAAPVIAKIAKEMEILTVGIVTIPFNFEGKKKKELAEQGVAELKLYCDTVLVILNDKIREIFGNLSIRQAFSKADDVLTTAAKSIAEIITIAGEMNIDFADVETVMKDAGTAVMGSATANGEDRAMKAAEAAINSPLLNNTDITGAKKILVSIMASDTESVSLDEIASINDYFSELSSCESLKFGMCADANLGDSIRVTVIATGFEAKGIELEKKVINLDSNKQVEFYNNKTESQSYIKKFNEQPEANKSRHSEEVEPGKKVTFTLDDFDNSSPLNKNSKEEPKSQFERNFDDIVEEKKKQLRDQAQDRIQRLRNLSKETYSNMSQSTFRSMLEEPAFKRKNIVLNEVPHSSERNISRFNLNDDNEILGSNRFLHDNVD